METVIDYEKELNSHIEQERAAVRLSSITGELLYHQGIELVFFRNHLNDVTVAEVLKLHTYSKKVVNKPVDIFTSVLLAKEILNLNLAPAKLDIGKLSSEWLSEKEDFSSPTEFLKNKLSGFELENAVRHLQANGVSRVLLTAPGKGIPNIVYGINQGELDLDNETIYSAASCTTNAISPVLKVINDTYGVVKGHIETVHAYTNDQNLLDNMHKKPRRGRSAAINMVITSTGAGNAVTKVIPDLKDKLTANAVRVPTPNGSLAILNLELGKETTLEELNGAMRDAALNGELINQIYYATDPEMVSSDIIGNTCCSVFDSNATIVSKDGKNLPA